MILKNQLERKLIEINDALNIHSKDVRNVGVFSGLPGVILFKFYYAMYKGDEQYALEGYELINRCLEEFQNGPSYLSLCDGAAGLGWTLDHLVKNDFLDADIDSMFSQLDATLNEEMLAYLKVTNFDFLHGGIGFSFYFLSRYEATQNTELKQKYLDYLKGFLHKMIEISVKDENGYITWLAEINYKTKEQGYNLSLSHGIASILGFYIRLAEHDDFRVDSESMIREISSYLLSTTNKNNVCEFPSFIYKDGTKEAFSRLAWCYGDMGIGLQLLHASKSLNDKELETQALGILKKTTQRKSEESTKVRDASICHGSFGLVQMYQQMYQLTKDTTFKKAADFWIQDGLSKDIHEDGFAGYKQKHGDHWVNDIGMLEGISGIGLVMIDYLSEEIYTWDEVLMIG